MIPGYLIQEEIFRSRKRVVFRGLHQPDNQPVIIKTIADEFPSPSDLALLKREFEIMKNVNSEGIARVFKLEKYQKNLALILHDVGGQTLRNWIDSREKELLLSGQVSVAEQDLIRFLRIAIQIAAAVGNLHQNNIIHKDINPKNVIVNLDTFQVELIDFSISSLLPRENQKMGHPSLLEGTLAYISPEQTGRMNRTIDYRTDFYSLGITLYEMFTGRLPFYSNDMLEQVHWHIARNPQPPAEINPAIPQPLSDIVMKLLSKNAEDRYNSAFGLKADLELCLEQMETTGTIQPFIPGQRELHLRFNIPQKLYGRETEITTVLNVFESACQGNIEILMVSGYSGIGKTSLIHEVHKPIVQRNGYFISGKFDQLNRIVPYSALIQAFQELVGQLLTDNAEKVEQWKKELLLTLGANCQIIIDVIPEVELITGKQPQVPQLGPTESQNRFNLVFQNFISVFARKEHPVVIFLDDLQWADSATLKLFQNFASIETHHLFLIGAYRDNEVNPSHPLMLTLNELEKSGIPIKRISLTPLDLEDLNRLIAETLSYDLEHSMPLASLVMNKTGGNPFFVNQFLRSLHQEQLIEFGYDKGKWEINLNEIQRRDMTDNVVELIANKIQKLSQNTQHVLKLAACISNRFDLNTLAIVNEKSFGATATDLWQAIQEGLIVPADDVYEYTYDEPRANVGESAFFCRFLHDRVQQAAYDLIPEEKKKEVHLKVGRLLLSRFSETEREERVFDITNQLNMGIELIENIPERIQLANLNLLAGSKAKSAAAYRTALSYLHKGRLLLDADCWTAHYNLSFDLHCELAQCEYLCGNFEEAERYFDLLLQKATSKLEKATIHGLRITQYEIMAKYNEAVDAGRNGLKTYGIELPLTAEEKQSVLQAEIQSIQNLIGNRKIEELIHLPVMVDPDMKMKMKLLMNMWAPTYIAGDTGLYTLIAARMVRLSLEQGNTEESAYGYVVHAITTGTGLGDYKSGYEFGKLALDVNENFHDAKLRAKVHHMFSCFVNLWRKPIRTCFVHSKEAYRSGLETGDFAYATYGTFHESWYGLLAGNFLPDFINDYTPNLTFLKQIKNFSFYDAQQIILHWGLCLQGSTQSQFSFSDAEFSEETYLAAYEEDPFFGTFYFVAKLHMLMTFEKFPEALEMVRKAETVIHALSGTIWQALLCFYHALTLTSLYTRVEELQKRQFLEKLAELQTRMKVWGENCPENFRHLFLLMSAEIAKITAKNDQAMNLYEDAIRFARENDMLQDEALANELYAKFWLQGKKEKIANLYMTEARYGYQQWGALAKVKDLEQKYPFLLEMEGAVPSSFTTVSSLPTTHTHLGALDISAVLKAAQAISSEIVLDQLLEKLMRIAIENAGAQYGILMLERADKEMIYAEGSAETKAVGISTYSGDSDQKFATSIVNYVKRTESNLVIGDASKDVRFSEDPYVIRWRPKSILCMPIHHQGKLIGILYLENNLTTQAFTPDRIQVIQMLSSQAAISLDNAVLYEDMKQEMYHRKDAEETLRAITEGTASVTGSDFFRSLVNHLAHALKLKYAFVTECTDESRQFLRTLAFWNGMDFGENFSYSIEATPCEGVIRGEECYFPKNLQALFPKDAGLVDLNAQSYFGLPLFDSTGKILGHLMVMDDKEMNVTPREISILRIFAVRARAEIERKRAEEALRAALSEVEKLKNRLQAENVYLQEEIKTQHNFEEIVGSSIAIRKVFQNIERVAGTDSTVLITGETGTGKELVARAIHNLSSRKESALIKVNCAALPGGLIESELFGHEKGAFTGAMARKRGRFELADGGSLFLDEVGELALETQIKLLRVLQEQEFERIGGSQTIKVNVRVITATNRQVEELVKDGSFRSDLFYRLNIFPIHLPALRERRQDIVLLTNYFVGRFSVRMGKKIDGVSSEALESLVHYDWPGNVRELANVLERAVILCDGNFLQKEHIGISLRSSEPQRAVPLLSEAEKLHIIKALEQTNWVVGGPSGAARLLGLNRTTLLARIKKLGISKPRQD